MKRIKITLALAATLLAANPMLTPAAPPHTGIQGQSFLYISWGTPIEIEPGVWIGVGDVQLPVATTFTVLSAQNHREVARVTTDANGLYSVSLPPGNYVVVSDPIGLSPFVDCTASLSPVEVTVHAKQFTLANIFYFRQGPCTIVGTPIQPLPTAVSDPKLKTNEGHHQSGITGRLNGFVIGNTPTGEARIVPYRVRVYTDTFPHELVAEVDAEVQEDTWWQQNFKVYLKPGRYFVVAHIPPAPEDGGRMFTYPTYVTVEKKQFSEVALSLVPFMPLIPYMPALGGSSLRSVSSHFPRKNPAVTFLTSAREFCEHSLKYQTIIPSLP